MTKLRRVVKPGSSEALGYSFHCPGCGFSHVYYTAPWSDGEYVDGVWVATKGPVWQFDGNLDSPTFSPSLLIHEGRYDDGTVAHKRCHLFVRDGKIQYCSDCGHDLAGKTIDMVELT